MTMLLEKPVSIRGGIHLPRNKEQSLCAPIKRSGIPSRLTIPLRQHIGVSAIPSVKVGERVLKGQEIGRSQGLISAPIHAGSSGNVIDIGDYPVPNVSGMPEKCIVIETDGRDEWRPHEGINGDVFEASPADIQDRIRDAGIVGLGGAGFPSAVKMLPGLHHEIRLLILNAAESEPFIACDEALLQDKAKEVVLGTEIIRHAVQADEAVIGIEDNKPEAISALRQAMDEEAGVKLAVLPPIYPSGGEKQLVEALTGLEVPSQGLPLDIGIICYNVGTAYAVYNAVIHGEPLLSRIVTVAGAAIKQPANLEALIGTPVGDLIEECGGYIEDAEILLMGGPMMGFPLQHADLPVTKKSNCVIAAASTDALARKPSPMPCIRCGDCATACPVSLLPQQLYEFARSGDYQHMKEYKLMDCIECGCCSYVCPSHIPLVQYYQRSKTDIWNIERKNLQSSQSRRRFEAREQRLDKENQPDEAGQGPAMNREQIAEEIDAAVEREKSRKEGENTPADRE